MCCWSWLWWACRLLFRVMLSSRQSSESLWALVLKEIRKKAPCGSIDLSSFARSLWTLFLPTFTLPLLSLGWTIYISCWKSSSCIRTQSFTRSRKTIVTRCSNSTLLPKTTGTKNSGTAGPFSLSESWTSTAFRNSCWESKCGTTYFITEKRQSELAPVRLPGRLVILPVSCCPSPICTDSMVQRIAVTRTVRFFDAVLYDVQLLLCTVQCSRLYFSSCPDPKSGSCPCSESKFIRTWTFNLFVFSSTLLSALLVHFHFLPFHKVK